MTEPGIEPPLALNDDAAEGVALEAAADALVGGEEFLDLALGEGGKVVDVVLALRAEAALGVTGHCAPVLRARSVDPERGKRDGIGAHAEVTFGARGN